MASYLRKVLASEYSPIPSDLPLSVLYDVSMQAWLPATFAVTYVLTTSAFNAGRPCRNYITTRWGEWLVLLHNVLLTVYSAWTFLCVGPAVFAYFKLGFKAAGFRGLGHAYCDSSSFLWDSYILHYGYLFYLSKYYEVVDTAILLLKGKKVKPLQVYHHAGAMTAMFAGIRYQSTPIVYFVVFNSFIHSLMYFYYSCTILKWPFPQFLKQSLTTLQIAQFLVGGALAVSYIFINLPALDVQGFVRESGKCMPADSVPAFAVWLNVAYIIPLTGLFLRFYRQSYARQHQKTA